jgi:2-C-methyl-D-erythritol 4-phosphate cytidylyltransferase/2-C-methyl-D-erythritol 2,4-cyclodiphosphate synthase
MSTALSGEPTKAAVVVVAAGRGERAGTDSLPKQYRTIGGVSVLRRAVDAFRKHHGIGTIIVVIDPEHQELYSASCAGAGSDIRAVTGGATRQHSVRAGLAALGEHAPAKVLIHDGARPFIDGTLIDRVLAGIGEDCAALPAVPISDTLKRGKEGLVSATIDRRDLYAAQTPQGFSYTAILEAHNAARESGLPDFTDDAALAEWAGIPVRLVQGSPDNVKLTWPKDIEMADRRFSDMSFPDIRTGNGYDVHACEAGDHVWLCGVRIPHNQALIGHSDADVALHALTDALLATCGAGDIGTHFPPSDEQWKGAASRIFLDHAAALIRAGGGRIGNVDVTLICEMPKITPHRSEMVSTVAAILGIGPDRVSVKATTNERLGFIGRQEGIAAIATATVIFPGNVPE